MKIRQSMHTFHGTWAALEAVRRLPGDLFQAAGMVESCDRIQVQVCEMHHLNAIPSPNVPDASIAETIASPQVASAGQLIPMTPTLGRLEKVELRDAWRSEAGDFTPWLARDENITLLADAIGLDLEVEAQEKEVGPFRADILCKDRATGHWVLIENQLERTDHIHLGQLITYASGLKAVTIVWIAARFTNEHRAALDWLNEITDGSFSFFGLEVELWRIGNSPVAPKFNVVCQPNDWAQRVSTEVAGGLTTTQQLQLEFWTAFRDYVVERSTVIKPTKPLPQTWMPMSIGRSGFSLVTVASTWDSQAESYDSHQLRVELVMLNDAAKQQFRQLECAKANVETEFGHPLEWAESLGKKQSKVFVRRSVDLQERASWPAYCDWLLGNLEGFHRVFARRVKHLKMEADPDGTAIPLD